VSAIIDTNIAIHIRDGDPPVSARVAELPAHPMLSVLSRVELEGGVYCDSDMAPIIRRRLDLMLQQFQVLPFTTAEAEAYGRIVQQCGFSRAKIIDRMIAATAIVADVALITMNGGDFSEISGLKLEDWAA
jgi:tRNA(fMet)-specific endonuclease VapC